MTAIGDRLEGLTTNECAALEGFVARLRQRYGDNLLRVVLFGSKARGDFDEESDLDLLVVVDIPEDHYWGHWLQIADIAWDVEFEHDVVLTTIIRTPAFYQQMQRDGLLFYHNIERDGVTLWTFQPDAATYKSA